MRISLFIYLFIYFIFEKRILGPTEKSRVGAQEFYIILQYKDKQHNNKLWLYIYKFKSL